MDVEQPTQRNSDRWSEHAGFELLANETLPRLRWIKVEVALTAAANDGFREGLELHDRWLAYVESWRPKLAATGAAGLDSVYVTDRIAFHYFHIQNTIITECFFGIGLAFVHCVKLNNKSLHGQKFHR